MADNVIELKVQVDQDSGALNVVGQNLEKVAGAASGTEKSFLGLSGTAANLAKSFLGFATAGAIISFFKSAVEEAERENQALNRLKFALEATGQSWTANAKQVQDWGAAIQNTTRFSDTEAFEAVGRLSRVTHDLSQAQRASQIAMGLSVISGKSLSETTEQLALLATGNERAVMQMRREYGSFIGTATTAQGVMDALAKATGKAAFEEDSLTKSSNQLKAAYSDLQEQIGRGATPVLVTLIHWTEFAIQSFQSLGVAIAANAAVLVTALTGLFAGISQASRFHFTAASNDLKAMATGMKAILQSTTQEFSTIWQKDTASQRKAMEDQTRVLVSMSKQQAEQRAKDAKEMNERIIKNEMEMLSKREAEGKKTNERIVKNEMEMLKKKAEHDNAAWTQFQKDVEGTMETVVKGYGDSIAGMVVDGKDFGKSMEEVWKSMARQFISAVTEMMIKWAAFQALKGSMTMGGGMFFAKGVDTVVNQPTMFTAGEAGPERVTVQPMAGSNAGGAAGSATNINIGDINVRVALENIDSANVQRLLDAMAREIRSKAGPAVRFSLAAKSLADQNGGRAF